MAFGHIETSFFYPSSFPSLFSLRRWFLLVDRMYVCQKKGTCACMYEAFTGQQGTSRSSSQIFTSNEREVAYFAIHSIKRIE